MVYKQFIREYRVEIVNTTAEDAAYVLSFDVYPKKNPRHPERHYGYWNKLVKIHRGDRKIVTIWWDWIRKSVLFNAETPDDVWLGDFMEMGDHVIDIVLYKNGRKISTHQWTDFIEARAGEQREVPFIRIDAGLQPTVRDLVEPTKLLDNERRVLSSVIWFLTWKCNFKCPYCWEVQRQRRGEFIPEDFKAWEDWSQAWNRLRPKTLDITGGEPWLQPGFIEMLEAFDPGIQVAITTNASGDLTEFVQKISPQKVFSMTLSFHPTQRMQPDLFLGKALMLKNRGFNITVNFVTWPEQMWLIPQYKDMFEKYGIRFHVDPYAPTPFYPYEFSEHEKAFLKQYIGEDRSHWFGDVEQYPVLCSGGYDHLNVHPDGDAYRCINDKIFNKNKVGNVLDASFSLNDSWTRCEDYHRCPGCDKDKVKVKRIDTHN